MALDARILAVAVTQYGLATTTQLRTAGLGPSGISMRVARGTLHRIHRRVYAVGHPVLSREAR